MQMHDRDLDSETSESITLVADGTIPLSRRTEFESPEFLMGLRFRSCESPD